MQPIIFVRRRAPALFRVAGPRGRWRLPQADSDSGAGIRTGPVGGSLKRGFDVVVAATGLVVLSPVLAVLALAIRWGDGGPATFSHTRVGYRHRPFRCLKLRTMVVDDGAVLDRHLRENPAAAAEWAATRKLKDDPRVTRLGRFLRTTSLDELPQLVNVLRGEMSIVGPRPVTEAEIEFYGAAGPTYLSALPGLTGLWQVSGRNDVSYQTRVALDVSYIERWSIWRDIRIVLLTVPAVVLSRGSY